MAFVKALKFMSLYLKQEYQTAWIIDSLYFYWLMLQTLHVIGCAQTVVRVATPRLTVTSASVSIFRPNSSHLSVELSKYSRYTYQRGKNLFFPSILLKTMVTGMAFNIGKRLLNTLVSHDLF